MKKERLEDPEKYEMGIDLETTKKHPYGHGASKLSPKELVTRGREYKGGQSYKTVFKQLNLLANINEHDDPIASAKFRKAAHLALDLYHKHVVKV